MAWSRGLRTGWIVAWALLGWMPAMPVALADDLSSDVAAAESDYIYPGKTRSEEAVKAAAEDTTDAPAGFVSGLIQALIFLSILGAGGFLLVQRMRQGKGPLKSRINRALGQTEGGLKIEETRMLGNKQYLVVVAYADKKMLIGVGPGLINHLCYLNDNFAQAFSDSVEDTPEDDLTVQARNGQN